MCARTRPTRCAWQAGGPWEQESVQNELNQIEETDLSLAYLEPTVCITSILITPKNPAINVCISRKSELDILRFFTKMGGSVLDWPNKYIINSSYCKNLIKARYEANY